VIEVTGLTKRYGDTTAVDDLTFTVRPGVVTGFLGPNGAGKSTTMRMIVGLDAPSAGRATVDGRAYAGHPAPMRQVGALLEARSAHPGRTARGHLLALAASNGIGRARVDEVIDLVGLHDVAQRRAGGFSLGMGQRLGIAVALLGDPATLILDEPVNGLDPEGVRWIRELLTRLAGEGRTVLLSSHLMSEMALTADHLIVVGRGRLLRDAPMEDFIRSAPGRAVSVRTPDGATLAGLLAGEGVTVASAEPGRLRVTGMSSDEIGRRAAGAGVTLFELSPIEASLEDAFMALTRDAVEYRTSRSGDAGAASLDEEVAA
jgi:ABC-2 type transport system ATP-binding protein